MNVAYHTKESHTPQLYEVPKKVHRSSKRGKKLQGAERVRQGTQYRALSDNELVECARSGENEAFGELVRRYRNKVNSLALKITKNEIDAQEVVQEVFLNAFSKLDSFKGTAAFSSWLYRVVANGALMLLRSRKRDAYEPWDGMSSNQEPTSLLLSSTTEWSTRADRIFERREIMELLEREFEVIPERYRTILILREIDGLSNKEIADVLGVTVAAVKSRLHRARLSLRKQLTEYWEEQ